MSFVMISALLLVSRLDSLHLESADIVQVRRWFMIYLLVSAWLVECQHN